jgi:hypothetical protein
MSRSVRCASLNGEGALVVGVGVGLAVVEGGRGETWGGSDVVGLAEVGVTVGEIGVTDLLDEHPAITTTLTTALIAIAAAATLIRSLLQPRMCRHGAPGARTTAT